MELDDAELKRYTFAVQAYDRRDQRRQRLLKTMSRLNNLITRSLATEHHYLVVGTILLWELSCCGRGLTAEEANKAI